MEMHGEMGGIRCGFCHVMLPLVGLKSRTNTHLSDSFHLFLTGALDDLEDQWHGRSQVQDIEQ